MPTQNGSGIYMISILTSDDARSIFTHVFQENVEQSRKITDLRDVLTSFIIAIGSGKDEQREDLTGLATGKYKIIVEWVASLVGIFFVSSEWSQSQESNAREHMKQVLREIELIYTGEVDQWLGGGGNLSLFTGLGAILGRFFNEYALVPTKQLDAQKLLQNANLYWLELNKETQPFLEIYLKSRSYRYFLEANEIAGETANTIVRELVDGIAPLHLVMKSPLPPDKIIVLITHLIYRGVLNLYKHPGELVDNYYIKLDNFLTKMKSRENLGPPANALYSSCIGDCFYFEWTEGKDCLTSDGKRTGCHGKVFNEGVCCEIFLNQIQTENL